MIQIALDGPSGAGKSTLAKNLANHLQYVYVDTGALYRSIGLFVRRRDTDPADSEAVAALLPEINLELTYVNGAQRVLLCGEDVSDLIRTPEISMYASKVSAIPAVRAFLLSTQKDIAEKNNVIMDGRDIGTVILPNANVKIFLVCSPEAKARRRYAELMEKGVETTYEEVLASMIERDRADSTRAAAPLIKAEDAIELNNSEMEPEETFAAALQIIKEKLS